MVHYRGRNVGALFLDEVHALGGGAVLEHYFQIGEALQQGGKHLCIEGVNQAAYIRAEVDHVETYRSKYKKGVKDCGINAEAS